MSYRLWIQPGAEIDLAETKRWYNKQRAGLGAEFVVSVNETLERLSQTPKSTWMRAKPPFADSPTSFITGSGTTWSLCLQ